MGSSGSKINLFLFGDYYSDFLDYYFITSRKHFWVSALYFSSTLTSFCLQVPDIEGHWAERPVTCHQKKTIHEQLFPSSRKETYDSEKICKTENDGVQTKFPWGILASLISKNWVRLSQAGRNDLRTRQKGIWIFKKKKKEEEVCVVKLSSQETRTVGSRQMEIESVKCNSCLKGWGGTWTSDSARMKGKERIKPLPQEGEAKYWFSSKSTVIHHSAPAQFGNCKLRLKSTKRVGKWSMHITSH